MAENSLSPYAYWRQRIGGRSLLAKLSQFIPAVTDPQAFLMHYEAVIRVSLLHKKQEPVSYTHLTLPTILRV